MRALYVFLQAILGLAIIAVAVDGGRRSLQDSEQAAVAGDDARTGRSSSRRRKTIGSTSTPARTSCCGACCRRSPSASCSAFSPASRAVLRWLFGPLFITLGAAPLIALMSMLLLWFGLGPNLTAIAVAIITVFPVANAVMMSLATRQGSISLAVVRGLRWGVVFGATALVICEMLTARLGAGTFIMNAGSQFQTVDVAAGIMLVFVPVIAVAAILQAIEEQLAA